MSLATIASVAAAAVLLVWVVRRAAARRQAPIEVSRLGLTVTAPRPAGARRLRPADVLILLSAAVALVGAVGLGGNTGAPAGTAPASGSTSVQAPDTKQPAPPAERASVAPARKPRARPSHGADGSAHAVSSSQSALIAEERRWCSQGDRMLAPGEHDMAAQAYREALGVRPRSARARAGLSRAGSGG